MPALTHKENILDVKFLQKGTNTIQTCNSKKKNHYILSYVKVSLFEMNLITFSLLSQQGGCLERQVRDHWCF